LPESGAFAGNKIIAGLFYLQPGINAQTDNKNEVYDEDGDFHVEICTKIGK
jgi:hypothetical protein